MPVVHHNAPGSHTTRGTSPTRPTRRRPPMEATGIALVTGASRGIGRGVAYELAARGFEVVATMRNPAAGEALAADAAAAGLSLRVERCDVTDPASIVVPDGLRVLGEQRRRRGRAPAVRAHPARPVADDVRDQRLRAHRDDPARDPRAAGVGRRRDLQRDVVVDPRARAVLRAVPGEQGRGDGAGRVVAHRARAVRDPRPRDHARTHRDRHARELRPPRGGDRAPGVRADGAADVRRAARARSPT